MSDISDAMELPRPGVTRTVKEMEEKGYLKKMASEADGRVTYIAVTRKGTNLSQKYDEQYFKSLLPYMEEISDEDAECMIRTIEKFYQIMCGIVTSWNSFLLGGSRALYSMAESYMIPKFFAKLHPKHKTPVNSLILIGALTMLAPFAGRKMLVWISDAGNFGCCFAYCMVALSFMILRKKEPDMPRPYKVPAYKFFGTMAVIMSGFMVAMYCIPGSGGNLILQEWIIVLGWCALGVVFYAICKKKYKESFGILVELISDEDAATLMPEADDVELDKVIDAAIDRVLARKAS